MADSKPQKLALLQAIAQQGMAQQQAPGPAPVSEINPSVPSLNLGDQRNAAVQGSQMRSDQIGAPTALNLALKTQAAKPLDAALSDQAAALTAYNRSVGGINAATGNYQSQVNAAMPIVNAITNTQIAKIQAQNAQNQQAQDWAKEQQQWQREDHQYQLAQRGADTHDLEASKAVQTQVNSAPLSQDAKDTFNAYVSQFGDFGSAFSQLQSTKQEVQSSKMSSSEKQKAIADLDAIAPYIRSYYYPTINPLQAAQAASNQSLAPAPQPVQASGGGNPFMNAARGASNAVTGGISKAFKNPRLF